jgi:hypothetical protein
MDRSLAASPDWARPGQGTKKVLPPQQVEVPHSQQHQGLAAGRPAAAEEPLRAEPQGKRPSPPATATQPRADALSRAPTNGAALPSALGSWNSVLLSSASFLIQYSEFVIANSSFISVFRFNIRSNGLIFPVPLNAPKSCQSHLSAGRPVTVQPNLCIPILDT